MLEQMRGDLGVLSTKVELGAEATKSSIAVVTESVRRLEGKVDRVLEAQADPAASPGGRAILEKIGEVAGDVGRHESRIGSLETFQTTTVSAFRTLRVQLTVVSTIVGIIAGGVTVYIALHPPVT